MEILSRREGPSSQKIQSILQRSSYQFLVVHLSSDVTLLHLGAMPRAAMNEPSDLTLIERIVLRDKAAFAALYDRHAARLYGLAFKMLRDEAAAEDAVQDTFVALWRKAQLYAKNRGQVLTWLYRVCRNVCLDRLKRAQVKYETQVNPAQLAEAFSLPATEMLGDTERTGERVFRALAHLTEGERYLIELAFFSGQSHSEIAATTGIPLGTVKSRIAAALRKLRRELADLQSERGDIL